MPRDSSGAYTLPTGNPVVDGTVIESEWANDTMADIAVQMNNVLTRDGLLGPIAPMLFVNGTVPLPGIAFQESPSTGLMRLPPNTVQMVINGVVKQAWSPAGTSIVGPISSSGPLGIPAGSVAAPGLFFNGDPDTGMYSPGPDRIGFAAGGAVRLNLSAAGNWVAGPASAGPAFVLAAGPEGVGLDIYGNGVVNDAAAIRFLDNAGTTPRMFIEGNNAGGYIGTLTAIPLTFYAGGTARVGISATGAVTMNTPTAGEHVFGGTTRIVGSAPYVIADGSDPNAFRGFQIAASSIVIGALESSPATGELRLSAGFGGFGGLQTFYTNGLERARLDAAGNFGVSVIPASTYGAGTLWGKFVGVSSQFNIDGGVGANPYEFVHRGGGGFNFYATSSLLAVAITAAGNVSIGNSLGVPAAGLDVQKNYMAVRNASFLGFMGSGLDLIGAGAAATDFAIRSDNGAIIFGGAGGVERMRVQQAGNVGINRQAPAYRLDSREDTAGAKQFRFGGAGLASLIGFCDAGYAGITNSDPYTGGCLIGMAGTLIDFYTAGVPRLRIAADGTVSANSRELGYRSLLRTVTSIVGTGALQQADNGLCRYHDAGTDLAAPVLADGTIITVFNASGASRLITGSGTTLTLAGTALTGTRTIAVNGFATLWWIGGTTVVVTGPGVT